MEKFGVNNLKLLVAFPVELGNIVGGIVEDKEKSWKSWLRIVYAVPEGLELLKIEWSSLKDEYNDLSDEERAEIKQFMIDKFDIANDKVEGIIESSFTILFNIESCIKEAVKLFSSIKAA